jgi:methylated-DNA-[protein]-cysteine S-methyltransferase
MNDTTYYSEIDSPLGTLLICGDEKFVTGLYLPEHKGWSGPESSWQKSDDPFGPARKQLAEYFAGERQEFDLPLKLEGTPFQRRVWEELTQIPFGTTVTYSELAHRVCRPTASRAVGSANRRNPVSIIVPCHRVIGRSGKLTGYAGGLDRKNRLLEWERSQVESERLLFADSIT